MTDALIRLWEHVTPRNDRPYEAFLEELGLSGAQSEEGLLPHNQEMLLGNIGRFPCLTRTERQERLGWSPKTMQRAVEALEGKYIEPVQVKKGGRGSSYVTYELTDAARGYMKKRQISWVPRHGGVAHHCAMEGWVKAKREAGFEAGLQRKLRGLEVDGLARRDGQTVALEVVGSDNFRRDREKFAYVLSHVDRLEVICLTEELELIYGRGLRGRLGDEGWERLELRRV